MPSVPFALYDAFSDKPFGGSQAAVISDAIEINGASRTRIAREIGMPATCFVIAKRPQRPSCKIDWAVR